MTGRLFLHIGTHKTGSTSFQAFLQDNRPTLIARGQRPVLEAGHGPFAGRFRANLAGLAHLHLRPDLVTGARVRGEVPPPLPPAGRAAAEDRIVARLVTLDAPVVILSSEMFCFLRSADEQAALGRMFGRLGRELRVVVAFRDPADWRDRWVRQLARNPAVPKALGAVPEHRRADGAWYYDTEAIRRFWSGLAPVTEIDYDAEPDMVTALARSMEIDMTGLARSGRRNVTAAT